MPSPAGREAGSGDGAPPYVRRRPEQTLLYQLVEKYFPAFKSHLAAQGAPLPKYVELEFEEFLLSIEYWRIAVSYIVTMIQKHQAI